MRLAVDLSISGVAVLTPPFPGSVPGFTLNSQGYLVSNADSSLWVFYVDSDGVFLVDASGNFYIGPV